MPRAAHARWSGTDGYLRCGPGYRVPILILQLDHDRAQHRPRRARRRRLRCEEQLRHIGQVADIHSCSCRASSGHNGGVEKIEGIDCYGGPGCATGCWCAGGAGRQAGPAQRHGLRRSRGAVSDRKRGREAGCRSRGEGDVDRAAGTRGQRRTAGVGPGRQREVAGVGSSDAGNDVVQRCSAGIRKRGRQRRGQRGDRTCALIGQPCSHTEEGSRAAFVVVTCGHPGG
jgi:hypothetical protein